MLRNFFLEIIGSKLKRYVTGDYVKNKLTILRKCLHTDPINAQSYVRFVNIFQHIIYSTNQKHKILFPLHNLG